MSIRFRRSFKLFPGVRINIGKNSISTSVGVRGAHITFGKNGTYIGAGIPGTGISERTKISGHAKAGNPHPEEAAADVPAQMGKHYKLGVTFWAITGTIILALTGVPELLILYWIIIIIYAIFKKVRKNQEQTNKDGN